MDAFPSPVSPLHWDGWVETASCYLHFPAMNPLGEFDATRYRPYYKGAVTPAVQSATATPAFRAFMRFAQWPLIRETPLAEPEASRQVEACDLRFGAPPQSHFAATAVVDASGRVLSSSFRF